MEPVRFGIIGVGGMGGNHARSFKEVEEGTLVAVADLNPDTAARVGEETGAAPFATAEELIDKGGVEAILIATPHFAHPPVAEYAAARGVHMLCEKPIAVTSSAADAMIAACAANNVLLGVMFQQRTDGLRRKVKAMLDGGELGAVHRISLTAPWYRTQAYYDSGAWRGTWKGEGGGILMNQAPHSLDQFVWMANRSPITVQALADTRLHSIEVENVAMAICDFGDGLTGTFYASTAEVPTTERLEIAGDKGVLLVEDKQLRFYRLDTPLKEHLTTSVGLWESPQGTWEDVDFEVGDHGHIPVTRAFCRAVRANDPSLLIADGADGLRALELANAILLAGYTHREVTLPLDRAAFDAMLAQLQAGTPAAQLRA